MGTYVSVFSLVRIEDLTICIWSRQFMQTYKIYFITHIYLNGEKLHKAKERYSNKPYTFLQKKNKNKPYTQIHHKYLNLFPFKNYIFLRGKNFIFSKTIFIIYWERSTLKWISIISRRLVFTVAREWYFWFTIYIYNTKWPCKHAHYGLRKKDGHSTLTRAHKRLT
jgi:hypothetical protein